MSKRYKMDGRKSRKMFSRTASGTHRKNVQRESPMRGGIRL